jgi:hypothetical protein
MVVHDCGQWQKTGVQNGLHWCPANGENASEGGKAMSLKSTASWVAVALLVLGVPGVVGAQSANTAAIAGVARDATGAVLPGVTVEAASPALIEKVRTAVTDAQGNYKIVDLRPGTYTVTFTITGFSSFKREGLELTTGITANVNAELKVGSLAETVTVTGASPVVDVQNSRTQTVLTREALDSLPTNKTLQSYAALTLGATMAQAQNQDVGGNQGEAGGFGYFAVHGGRGNDERMTIDGMHFYALIGSGAAGNRTNYVNQMAVAETVIQTSGMMGEAETGGVQINVVPKDGANNFSGSFIGNGTSGKFQSTNLDANLTSRGISTPPNVKEIYDLGVGLGGAIVKDKLWFYTAHRRWGTQNYVPGNYFNATPHTLTYTPDLSKPAYTWIHNRDHQGRLTWQINSKNKLAISQGFQWDANEYYEVDRGRAPEAAGRLTWSPNAMTQATWSNPRTNRLLFEAGTLALYEIQNNYPVGDGSVIPTDISVSEIGGGVPNMYNARATGLGQVDYGVNDAVTIFVQRFSASYVTGTHAFKAGVNALESPATTGAELLSPVSYVYRNGVPFQVTEWRSPRYFGTYVMPTLGIFAQDQWTTRRLTLNLGVRFDYVHSYAPAVTLPAVPLVGAPQLNLSKVDNVPNWKDVTPRLGAAYDVFGNGRTAVKGSISKYNIFQTVDLATGNAPANRIAISTSRSWTDANHNLTPDCNFANPAANGECGPWLTPTFGQSIPSTTYDPSFLTSSGVRPYTWQGSLSLQQQLRPGVALNVGYFRTWYGNFTVTINRALPNAAWDPYCVTAPVDSRLGAASGQQICGLYDQHSIVANDNFVTLASAYGNQTEVSNFVDIGLQARFGKGGILQGGVSTGRTITDNCGLVQNNLGIANTIATYNLQPSGTGARNTTAFCRVTVPWSAQTQFKVAGNYPLPWYDIQVSGTLQNLPGIPIFANLPITGANTTLGRPLALGSANVAMIVPYTLFEGRLNQVDLRFAKSIRFSRYRAQGQFDIYNAFNANTILQENPQYGPTWQKPLAVLGARLMKFGVQVDF